MSEAEIRAALLAGKTVCWMNAGYVLDMKEVRLWVTFTRNGYRAPVDPSEYPECYVLENHDGVIAG